ncbi:hypothetical protein [Streptosporangium sp. OZ121]|uniref:hypothetical protein n=1 Tax=Streptosporangium sp. OZ121 TaxID=3444183 RepID=UPI003F7A2504
MNQRFLQADRGRHGTGHGGAHEGVSALQRAGRGEGRHRSFGDRAEGGGGVGAEVVGVGLALSIELADQCVGVRHKRRVRPPRRI